MNNKTLGIIGVDYDLTAKYFETIIKKTNALIDQDNIIINLIFTKKKKLENILSKCLYLESINTSKIIILADLSLEDFEYIAKNISIPICNKNVNIDEIINEFRRGKNNE